MTTRFYKNITASFIKSGLLCFLLLFLFSCKKGSIVGNNASDTIPAKTQPVVFLTPTYDPLSLDTITVFNSTPAVKNLSRTDLVEISGVAASRLNPGILYIHNDSGNLNQVYLTDVTGADKGTLNLTPVSNRDWEDIAVGPGPVAGKSYVYVADIGDNDSKYKSIFIYRFVEPDLAGKIKPVVNIDTVDKIELKYPEGPRNAETLMVDPQTKDIYIASKESNTSKIYVASYPQNTSAVTVMTPVVKLLFNKATGGDISPDGTEILLRSKEIVWYWKLSAGTSISAGLLTKPHHAPYANNEPQGEGIGFAADGSGYFTTTEVRDYPGNPTTISFYKRK
ncbi:hypothetical protein [Mucilaginibacter flavidus]|uniref:hypothetical protein n=1 Tax=Mucilaginibacter flavidus TaxID=2949309 RepID=UPI002093EE7C|nr:hypothetical protein [Mucilaginibacter flavidus]MCO5948354.1 hypothetical protein [Mucilaginibacter flavidus]